MASSSDTGNRDNSPIAANINANGNATISGHNPAGTGGGAPPTIRAPRGLVLNCKGWPQEAAMRMLMNNLDPEVAEDPANLIVYGGSGKAARNWESYHKIVRCLTDLEDNETLLVQSGKPVGIFRTHKEAPRVLISNSMLVPAWANWDNFWKLERQGLTMYGQMTAGSWIYIGTQGILQGTFETLAAAARTHFGENNLAGRLVLSGGLGGMGGAQPLAATMNGAAFLGVEVDPARIQRRLQTGYLDRATANLDEALGWLQQAKQERTALSVAVEANAADLYPELVRRNVIPDLTTDQTSAHDPINGYIPNRMSLHEALQLRYSNPDHYRREAYRAMGEQVAAMLQMQKLGSHVFDYGNNIREGARLGGGVAEDPYSIPGFVPAYIRPLFCKGSGPFRWVALSGDPEDILVTDRALMDAFRHKKELVRWLELAGERVQFQGLPARICWLGYGERAEAGRIFNGLVRDGRVSAPIAIGRDHLDCGSVASPNRETEGMLDGSDAIADWPVLNALLNTAAGATWVSFHHGGGVGIGYSLHAGMVVVADGTDEAEGRLERVLTADPGTGVMRHADAGYESAARFAREQGIKLP